MGLKWRRTESELKKTNLLQFESLPPKESREFHSMLFRVKQDMLPIFEDEPIRLAVQSVLEY